MHHPKLKYSTFSNIFCPFFIGALTTVLLWHYHMFFRQETDQCCVAETLLLMVQMFLHYIITRKPELPQECLIVCYV